MALTPNQIGALIVAYFGPAPTIFGAGLTPTDDGKGNITVTGKPDKDPATVEWLDNAIAIVLAESGGNPDAKNTKSSASGLWQIMASVHKAQIDFAIKAVGSESGNNSLTVFDPRVNTMVAGQVYQGAGNKWTPWQAYNTGDYRKFKGHGSKVWDHLNSPANITAGIDKFKDSIDSQLHSANLIPLGVAGDVANRVSNAMPSWISPLLAFVKQAGLPIGVFLLALVLIVLGIVFLIAGTKPAQAIVDKAIP